MVNPNKSRMMDPGLHPTPNHMKREIKDGSIPKPLSDFRGTDRYTKIL